MEHESERLKKVEEMLNGIAEEFAFDPKLRTPVLGRSLGEIEATKTFPVIHRCAETAMVVAHGLQKLGFEPEIVLRTKVTPLGNYRYHFFVGFHLDGKNYQIDTLEGLPLKRAARTESEKGFKFRRFPFRDEKKDSLKEVIRGPAKAAIALRSLYQPLRPRLWPLEINKRKNEKRAFQFNKEMKARTRK